MFSSTVFPPVLRITRLFVAEFHFDSLGNGEFCFFEFGSGYRGLPEGGTFEIGTGEVGRVEGAVIEGGSLEIRAFEVDTE